MVRKLTAGNKVLFHSVKKDTGMRRKILWLIGNNNLKTEWQKERKRVANEKFLLVEKIRTISQLTFLYQQKRKRKWHHQPTSPSSSTASDSSTNKELHNDKFKITVSLKIKNLNGNYPKVWPTTQTNNLKSTFYRIVWKRLHNVKGPSSIILIMTKS